MSVRIECAVYSVQVIKRINGTIKRMVYAVNEKQYCKSKSLIS